MKILHTSDWHLGHQLYDYDRLDEHRHAIAQMIDLARNHRPDAFIIAGDIFDTQNPSLAAQQLWADSLAELLEAVPDMEVIAIAGNHDSGSRIAVNSPLLRRRLHLVGREPETILLENAGKRLGAVVAVPYLPEYAYRRMSESNEADNSENTDNFENSDNSDTASPIKRFYERRLSDARKLLDDDRLPVIAVSHLAVSGADVSSHPRRDFNFFSTDEISDGFAYHALGHIHFPQTLSSCVRSAVRYSGSPLPLSFDEPYSHSISLIEIDKRDMTVNITPLPLDPLRVVLTLPKEGKAIEPEEVHDFIKSIRSESEAYLRVRVYSLGPVPESVNSALRKEFKESAIRFCLAQPVLPPSKGKIDSADTKAPVTMEDIREMDPLEIADLHFQRKYSRSLPEELRSILAGIFSESPEGNGPDHRGAE